MKTKFKNELSIGTRIKECREALNLSRNSVCKQLDDLAISTLQKWESNEREPSAGMIVKLSKILKTTPTYLLTGEKEEPNTNYVDKRLEEANRDENILMIPSFASINVSAGFGSFNEGVTEPDGEEPYTDALITSLGVKPHRCAVFWANGNSMEPTIADCDQLLVDLSKTEAKGSDKIYLVQNGDSVWVKRVKMTWDGVELISDNKDEYPPIVISREEAEYLQIIGQVVHIGHSLI